MYELQLFASEIKFQDQLDLERIMPGKCNTLLSCPDHHSTFFTFTVLCPSPHSCFLLVAVESCHHMQWKCPFCA